MISNGPGDPGAMNETIRLVSQIVDSNIPTFGTEIQGNGTRNLHP
jgi:carbamoylphosphate synthase small subunit